MSYTSASLRKALENQIRRLQKKTDDLKNQSQRLSMIRLFIFVGGLALVYMAGSLGPEWLFWITLITFIGGFYKLITIHKKIDKSVERFTVWKNIRRNQLARQSLNWSDIPDSNAIKSYQDHPFAFDLNIIGKHSLLSLINTGHYQGSTDFLAQLLLQQEPDPEEVADRQSVIKELSSNASFRDRLQLLAQLNSKQELSDDWTLEELREHLNNAEKVNYNGVLSLLGGLSILNIVLGVLYLTGYIAPYVIFTFVLYLVIYNFNSDKISGLYNEASQIVKLLKPFKTILEYLETYSYSGNPNLKDFCSPFWKRSNAPSGYINQIVRIAGAASSQQSEIIWVLLNFLVPWDLYYAQKLSGYKQEVAPFLSRWLDRYYKLEALSSLANFSWLNPHYNFALPETNSGNPFEAKNLGHPLIPEDEKVTNNLTIHEKGEILLITGSNMAGKSTFLRTVGINLALYFSGGPVNASSLTTIPFRLFSSINITDSLDEGLSHFYAEVKQLRKLLTFLEDNHPMPVFFLVDEIYRGTNNRERLQGSKAFLQNVAGKNGIGMVSTHDLELAQLEETIPELSNWHFSETIDDGKMSFEYKLKSGPCPSTNALKIMEIEGLPV
ncbi:MutS family DNA mismatch repair protein [Aliifodinibius salicampi]|uniref:MutS family DNA mismatch repair protein n=1 Tax=Fodinibius salicampi TaxID=1920655 RepID=A0ABT3PX43_9BACT|nr:MutS family DNA mismatch repair protein [Fodinibius salicampi]MCW9712424.1 MutS family DNA mismatch repair protein [Fodinibius salicampi]